MNQTVSLVIFGLAALALALMLVFGFATALDIKRRLPNEPLPYAFFGIVLAIMAAPLATERLLTSGLATVEASLEDIGSSFWITRILTALVLIVCIERVGRYFLQKGGPAPKGMLLWWSFFAFALAGQLLNAAFGAKPSFDQKSLYAFVAYFAFFLVAQQQPDRLFKIARWALLLFLLGSAMAIPVRPAALLEFGFTGFLPGINFRYYGLATHANTMGPLAVACLILLWRYPIPARWLNYAAWALTSASLLFSQSKTSIAIGVAVFIYLWIYRRRSVLAARADGSRAQFALLMWTSLCIVLAALTLGILLGSNYLDWAIGRFENVTGGQWATFTGRTRIWALAWHEFLSHPVFGYGPTIWDPVYRFYAQLPFAAHAHNQLMQSLSSAGAVGGATVLFYAFMLLVFAVRANARSGGISIALVGLILVRCIFEVPLATASMMQAEFLVQLLALSACVGFAPEPVLARASVCSPTSRTVPSPTRVTT